MCLKSQRKQIIEAGRRDVLDVKGIDEVRIGMTLVARSENISDKNVRQEIGKELRKENVIDEKVLRVT